MKLKRILSGVLAAGLLAGSIAAPEALPLGNGIVIEAEAASSKPTKPDSVKVTLSDEGKAKVTWKKVSGADGYEIYTSGTKNGKYKRLSRIKDGSKQSLSKSGLSPVVTYYFKMRSFKVVDGKRVYSSYTSPVRVRSPYLAALYKKAPIYANFIENQAEYPVYLELEIAADGMNGKMGVAIKSSDSVAVIVEENGTTGRIIMNNGHYYVVSDDEKTAIDFGEVPEESAQEIANSSFTLPDFDLDKVKIKTGTKKYKNKEYLYETITDETGLKFYVYADTETKDVKYLVIDDYEYKITAFTHKVDDDLFKIPKSYEIMTLEDMYG